MISNKVLLRFWQLLGIAGMMMLSQSLLAAEQQPTDLTKIDNANLPQFVSQLGDDYYQQLESLVTYYQLYQQKRDPRALMSGICVALPQPLKHNKLIIRVCWKQRRRKRGHRQNSWSQYLTHWTQFQRS